MLRFILYKIRNKKWMILSLLLGNLLMVAIASSSSMYTQAALQRMLTSNLSEYMEEENKYPGTLTIYRDGSPFAAQSSIENRKIEEGTALFEELVEDLKLPVLNKGIRFYKASMVAHH